jgi:hypothetical protein
VSAFIVTYLEDGTLKIAEFDSGEQAKEFIEAKCVPAFYLKGWNLTWENHT